MREMGSIVTFYSYKGGVGRSMALANVAVLLARRGKKVLAVDWDLEAPGLPRYFSALTLTQEGAGLLPFMMQQHGSGGNGSYREFLYKVTDPESGKTFDVLPSGNEADREYSKNLERFSWRSFFRAGGGDLIEKLRTEWKRDYDTVLIDSRTGLTDSGGICTIQLPDIVIAIFTANYQSMYGVRDVMRLAQQSRQRLSFDRMSLTIVPVASRFGMRSEFRESKRWLDEFANAFQEFFSDWLPSSVNPRQVLDRMKVPQVDYFGFGERLAVIEDSSSNTEGMLTPYNILAELIDSELKDLQAILPPESWETASQDEQPKKEIRTSKDYSYDVYVSYSRDANMTTWVREFFWPLFLQHLEAQFGRSITAYVDFQEVRLGDAFKTQRDEAINHSRVCIALLTTKYFLSKWCRIEFYSFLLRSRFMGLEQGLILPVTLHGGEYFPPAAKAIQAADFREFFLTAPAFRSSPRYLDFEVAVRNLAQDVLHMVEKAPSFNPNWRVIRPTELDTTELEVPENLVSSPRLRA